MIAYVEVEVAPFGLCCPEVVGILLRHSKMDIDSASHELDTELATFGVA